VVPDTSAFIEGVYFKDVDWITMFGLGPNVRVVVPIIVVEEIDKVRGFDRGKAQSRARQVTKDLRQLVRQVPSGLAAQLRPKVTIQAFPDDDWHQRHSNNDSEIIDQALLIQELTGKEVLLTCVDVAMEIRA